MLKIESIIQRLVLIIVSCVMGGGKSLAYAQANSLLSELNRCNNGIERYWALYNAHISALNDKVDVDYRGIDTLEIEIPPDAKSIPLKHNTDFQNLRLSVLNNTKDFFLFEKTSTTNSIELEKENIDNGDFTSYPELRQRTCIIVLRDNTPWVRNREGYNYGHTRKDILLVKDGKADNEPISPYNNEWTNVSAWYVPVDTCKKTISHLRMTRQDGSECKTYFLRLENQYNVEIEDIEIHTPQNSKVEDLLFNIRDCCGIAFKDVIIDGTYSRTDYSGYGISMNNVYDSRFVRLVGKANWGLFGNNNINKVLLADCDINRFDIHCYGRDLYFSNCKFRDLYNQIQSIKGTVTFDSCEFFNSYPCLVGGSYNAYTKYDIIFKDCIVHAKTGKGILFLAHALKGEKTTERQELRQQQFPNLSVENLTIDLTNFEGNYYLYAPHRKRIQKPLYSIPAQIDVNGLVVIPESARERVYTTNLTTWIREREKILLRRIFLWWRRY